MTLNLKIAAIGALAGFLLISHAYCYHLGADSQKIKWLREMVIQQDNNLKHNKEVSNVYQKNIAALRSAHRVRDTSGLQIPDTACRYNAASGKSEFTREMARDIGTLINDTDLEIKLQAERLERAQEWINSVSR